MPHAGWTPLEPDIDSILARDAHPIESLARGDVPAIIVRGAFPPAECANLIDFLIDEDLMFAADDPRVDAQAIPATRVDRWTRQGLNPATSTRRRIDLGTSLGNLGDDKENFLAHSADAHELFDRLFADRPNPIELMYSALARLSPGKRVTTAYEPDGRHYGPAIFRVHYGGYTYGPHFDSVRNREQRSNYAVYRFERQLAGVLCIQNATLDGVSAQAIVHRQFWNAEIDPLLEAGTFHDYADEHRIPSMQIDLEPGDLYFFNTGHIHEVPGVPGDLPRAVLATFIGYSDDDEEVMVWS